MMRLYFLCDPSVGAVRYVGKTVKTLAQRLTLHLCEARRGVRNHRCAWLRSLSGPPIIELVAEVPGDGCSEEIELIAGLRCLGVSLVNGTAGGDGTVGYRHSAEVRAKISAALTPERREKIAAGQRGRKASAALRRRLSLAHAGKPLSEGTKAKMSVAQTRRMLDPKTRRAFVSLSVGRQVSLETRAKISAAKKGRKHTEAALEKMRASKYARDHGLLRN